MEIIYKIISKITSLKSEVFIMFEKIELRIDNPDEDLTKRKKYVIFYYKKGR